MCKNNFNFILLILSLCSTALPEQPQDEVATVEILLKTTEKQLEIQNKLRVLVIKLKEEKELFMKEGQNKQHAGAMVRTATELLQLILKARLEHLFSSEYMDELALFASIAQKNRPHRP